ncbi:DUF3558 family protein [Plantactinospora sp. GCM10030261]|uniref:DUF3558 family protein n=1 Tax=Plantactinospora sp. GCM10030261 TaxID=3273420 RepID=UPI00361B909D
MPTSSPRPATRRPAGVRPTPLIGLLVAPLLFVLTGCGGEQDPAPSGAQPPAVATEAPTPTGPTEAPAAAPKVEPCSLVSKKEAEQLAGTPLEDAKPVRETCTYTGPVTGPTAQVEIFVGDGAKKYLDIERDLGHELRPLTGVGDEAYATDEAAFVSKGGLWVSIRLVRLNDPKENRKPLEALARTVAGRL